MWKFLNRKAGNSPKAVDGLRSLPASKRNVDARELLGEWVYDYMGVGVFLTDVKGVITHCNAEAAALTDVSADDLKGKHLAAIFSSVPYDLRAHLGDKKFVTMEIKFTDFKTKQRWLRVTVGPLVDSLHGLAGFASIFHDITGQKVMQQRIEIEAASRKARERVLAENQKTFFSDNSEIKELIGQSPHVENIRRLVDSVARTNTNILILGETGTGREAVARAIHAKSSRRDKPFVVVSCGAIPENLIEDELFGHVRGAFTGAISDRKGLIMEAHEGTVFFDEVAELPLHLQTKLLAVLDQKSVAPVGANRRASIDVRVIAGSNIDVKREADAGRFRHELLYRLNVVTIPLPPLWGRREDIPVLTHYLIKHFANLHKKQVDEISTEAMACLMNYRFPGNISELESIVNHAVTTATTNTITVDNLSPDLAASDISSEVKVFEKTTPGGEIAVLERPVFLEEELATHEKCLLLAALKKADGVQKKAAELLGINYRSFRHRLEKYSMLGMTFSANEDQKKSTDKLFGGS